MGENSAGAARTGVGSRQAGQPVRGSGASRFLRPVEPGSVLSAPLCGGEVVGQLIPRGLGGCPCLGRGQTGV